MLTSGKFPISTGVAAAYIQFMLKACRAASFNPWVGISWMVSGKSVSGTEVLAKDNRLARVEALVLFTRGHSPTSCCWTGTTSR
jgi:hypothetical protein